MHIVGKEKDKIKQLEPTTPPLCPKCRINAGYRIRRPLFFRVLMFWLPIRRYFCYSCNNKYLVMKR